MICNKKRITVRKQIQHPTKIDTSIAEAELKQDFRLLRLICGADLIAKEFQKHHKCYADYTRDVCNTKPTTVDINTESLYEKGDYVKVCKMVDEQIIGEKKGVSLVALLQVYGIKAWPRQYGLKLKSRLSCSCGDKLLFLNAEPNSPQVVISKECLNTRAMGNTIKLSDEFIV